MRNEQVRIIQGRACVKRGNRMFPIPKLLGTADAIAQRSNVEGNWGTYGTNGKRARMVWNSKDVG